MKLILILFFFLFNFSSFYQRFLSLPKESANENDSLNKNPMKMEKNANLSSSTSSPEINEKRLYKNNKNDDEDDDVVNLKKNSDDDVINRKFPSVQKLVEMYSSMIDLKQNKFDDFDLTIHASSSSSSSKSLTVVNIKNFHEENIKKEDLIRKNKNLEQKTNLYGRLNERRSPVSDEGYLASNSVYYSSDEENCNQINSIKIREKVLRSSSSDSALGMDDDLITQEFQNCGANRRRTTLTVSDIPLRPALLPLAEPTKLSTCDSPTRAITPPISLDLCPIRSELILEGKVIELPDVVDVQNQTHNILTNSRRESFQSTQSMDDCTSVPSNKIRFMRTPSVVVSDYSDEYVNGLTLEEVEYFKEKRLKRRNSFDDCSDISAASSCSNLNYCGSHISLLDGLQIPERKISSCSTCSNLSADDDESTYSEQGNDEQLQQQNEPPKEQIQKKKVSLNDI